MIGAMPNDVKPLSDPPAYVDPISGKKYPISAPRWRSDTGAPLMITPLAGIGRDMIDTGKRSLWRYAAALPVDVADPITMGEGCTPLVSRRWRGATALFKLEWFSPTGSFKDRGASVMVSILRSQGVTKTSGGQLRKRRSGDRSLCRGGRHCGEDSRPGLHGAGQDRADARLWRRDRAHSWNASGRQRRGGAPGRDDLLRRPQLAAVLPAGNEDAGLRALGGSQVQGARQCHHPDRRGQQHPRLRYRLQRASPPRRDRKAAPAVRGAAGELRAASRKLRGRVG